MFAHASRFSQDTGLHTWRLYRAVSGWQFHEILDPISIPVSLLACAIADFCSIFYHTTEFWDGYIKRLT